jgi:hypothetical protein
MLRNAMTSDVAHGAAALREAAATSAGAAETVINRKLLACANLAKTVEEDLTAEPPHRQIRVATVIDKLGATSSD